MRKVFAKRLVLLLCLCVVGYGAYQGFLLYKGRNDGFSIERIYTKLPNSPEWEFAVSSEKQKEVVAILAQPFHYLGHGFQFYAFESADGKYVLKFFRHQRLHPPVLYDWFPDVAIVRDLKAKKSLKRQERVDSLFSSIKIAYEAIPQETGLVFVHLNKTKNQFQPVMLIDLMGQEYRTSLDDTEFLLQEKATFIKQTIKGLMSAGQLDEAKKRINQIFELMKEVSAKGVLDLDGALISKNNIGFIKDRAIYIDTGKFVLRESIKTKERFQQDLKRLKPLHKWLVSRYPPLAAHFDKQQKKALASF